MRWSLGIPLLALLGLVCATNFTRSRPAEPVYAGKSVTQWLEAGYEDCAKALQEIGPVAGPYVLAKLAREDPRYGSESVYRVLWARLPAPVRKVVPKPKSTNFDQLRATSALLEIGPQLVPVPALRVKDNNPAVRSVCARALGLLRRQGANIRPAFPALTEALGDPKPEVAALAALALGHAPASNNNSSAN